MRIRWRDVIALRTDVIAWFILLWNLAFAIGLIINGIHGDLEHGPGRWAFFAATVAAGSFTLAIVLNERLRESLLDPERRHLYNPLPFLLLTLIAWFLAFEIAT